MTKLPQYKTVKVSQEHCQTTMLQPHTITSLIEACTPCFWMALGSLGQATRMKQGYTMAMMAAPAQKLHRDVVTTHTLPNPADHTESGSCEYGLHITASQGLPFFVGTLG